MSRLLESSFGPPSVLFKIRSIFRLPLKTRSKTPCPSLNLSTDVGTILKQTGNVYHICKMRLYLKRKMCSHQWLEVWLWFPMLELRSGGLTSSICGKPWWAGEEKELCGDTGGCNSERGPPGDSALWHKAPGRVGVPREHPISESRVPCFLFLYSSKET